MGFQPSERKNLPLIYSCSGSSNVAQIANAVAVRLDRDALMEMSCIAGVGGDVPSLVRTAKSGRAVWVIDGCPMECARHCLKRHDVEVDRHFMLSEFNLKKVQHELPDDSDIEHIYDFVRYQLTKI
jgi:uncharacterized metal-binding protein